MTLSIDGEIVECPPGRVVRFSGDSVTIAQLVDGPVVDLGLMTVRGSVIGSMVVIADAGDVAESDVIVAVGEAAFEDKNGKHYILGSKDALLDVRGYQLVLLSGTAIAMQVKSL
jgi:environmental stress-induced protein Ves